MRTLVIANQKGGCGKTTTAVNLSAALGELGRRVLLVDMDPMRTASKWYGFLDREGGEPNLMDVLQGKAKLDDIVQETTVAGVYLAQSTRQLSAAEARLKEDPAPQFVLRDRLADLTGDWDYVIVDTHPDLDLLTVIPLTACNEVYIAVQLSNNDLEGMPEFLETVSLIKSRLNPSVHIAGVIPCRTNLRTKDGRACLELLQKHFGDVVCRSWIRENVKLRECSSYRLPVTHYDPRGAGAADYRALANELEERSTAHGS